MTRGIKILLYFLIITIITCLIFFSYSFTKKIRADLKHKDILLLKDYRGKLLPETQFTKLYLKKIPLDKDSNLNIEKKSMPQSYNIENKFFIEIDKDNVIIVKSNGTIAYYKINDFLKNKLNEKKDIKNIFDKKISSLGILGTMIHKNEIFVSYAKSSIKNNNCFHMAISKAKLNYKNLSFKEIFSTKNCDESSGSDFGGGRMVALKENNKEYILLTTSDYSGENAQDLKSPYGKILQISLINYQYEIFSLGHRNPQGLLNMDNKILSTEHGPMSGDEINLISKNNNYGWKVASYGEPYKNFSQKNDYKLLKNHKKNNFEEPIYAYTPAIGISEIVNVNKNFENKWENNFLVTSLNGRSIFRTIFGENFTKVITQEKIFIGERIRDIIYDKNNNIYLLSLEDTKSIGILTKKDLSLN